MEERHSYSRPILSSDTRWREMLSDAVRTAFLRTDRNELLVRVGVPVKSQDAFTWLDLQDGPDRIVWGGRHRNKIRAMVGAADVVSGRGTFAFDSGSERISRVLNRPGDEMKYFGGFKFDSSRPADEIWDGFEDFRFVLPRFELHVSGDRAQVYCNLLFPEDGDHQGDILAAIERLQLADEPFEGELTMPIARRDLPDRITWIDRINEIVNIFSRGLLEKVVLARRVDYTFSTEVSAIYLLKRLVRSTPNCFHFYFESKSGSTFVGATPERLFYRNGRQIESEAVAGTRPRGESDADDEALRTSLLTSEKDQREHAFVRETIMGILRSYCSSVTIDSEASEMKLARGRHLVSRISGVLQGDVLDGNLIRDLHPTPAVGGHPTRDAVERISEFEGFDRGWYAGPIGWFGRDCAEFAVALRCGVVRGNRLSLFSGAGIVVGSEPDAEWTEIEQKIEDFVNVLGLELKLAK